MIKFSCSSTLYLSENQLRCTAKVRVGNLGETLTSLYFQPHITDIKCTSPDGKALGACISDRKLSWRSKGANCESMVIVLDYALYADRTLKNTIIFENIEHPFSLQPGSHVECQFGVDKTFPYQIWRNGTVLTGPVSETLTGGVVSLSVARRGLRKYYPAPMFDLIKANGHSTDEPSICKGLAALGKDKMIIWSADWKGHNVHHQKMVISNIDTSPAIKAAYANSSTHLIAESLAFNTPLLPYNSVQVNLFLHCYYLAKLETMSLKDTPIRLANVKLELKIGAFLIKNNFPLNPFMSVYHVCSETRDFIYLSMLELILECHLKKVDTAMLVKSFQGISQDSERLMSSHFSALSSKIMPNLERLVSHWHNGPPIKRSLFQLQERTLKRLRLPPNQAPPEDTIFTAQESKLRTAWSLLSEDLFLEDGIKKQIICKRLTPVIAKIMSIQYKPMRAGLCRHMWIIQAQYCDALLSEHPEISRAQLEAALDQIWKPIIAPYVVLIKDMFSKHMKATTKSKTWENSQMLLDFLPLFRADKKYQTIIRKVLEGSKNAPRLIQFRLFQLLSARTPKINIKTALDVTGHHNLPGPFGQGMVFLGASLPQTLSEAFGQPAPLWHMTGYTESIADFIHLMLTHIDFTGSQSHSDQLYTAIRPIARVFAQQPLTVSMLASFLQSATLLDSLHHPTLGLKQIPELHRHLFHILNQYPTLAAIFQSSLPILGTMNPEHTSKEGNCRVPTLETEFSVLRDCSWEMMSPLELEASLMTNPLDEILPVQLSVPTSWGTSFDAQSVLLTRDVPGERAEALLPPAPPRVPLPDLGVSVAVLNEEDIWGQNPVGGGPELLTAFTVDRSPLKRAASPVRDTDGEGSSTHKRKR